MHLNYHGPTSKASTVVLKKGWKNAWYYLFALNKYISPKSKLIYERIQILISVHHKNFPNSTYDKFFYITVKALDSHRTAMLVLSNAQFR
jgi:hypothetical protein